MKNKIATQKKFRFLNPLFTPLCLLIILSMGSELHAQTMSRANRVFIQKGIQFQAWMNDDSSANSHFPIGSEWTNLNFTAPAWYESDLYNSKFFAAHPNSQWATVKAPFADQLKRGPNATETANGFLNPSQLGRLSTLTTMGFGDEEQYSIALQGWLRDWYAISHSKYPDVLTHNNQYFYQWSENQLRTYLQIAKPDLLTLDEYFFTKTKTEGSDRKGNLSKHVLEVNNMYRALALEGHDGTGNRPIAFGHYLLGYKRNETFLQAAASPPIPGYVISESQIYGTAYMGLAMGMKWLNVFRYADGSDSFIWRDNSGKITPQYTAYSVLAGEVNKLSPHLSRLQTTDIYVLPGQHMSGTRVKNNPLANNRNRYNGGEAWSASGDPDPYITNITVVNNNRKTNGGLKADVLIGFFKPVPGIRNTTGVTMAPVHHHNANYFMLVNGLTIANGCCVTASHPDYAAQIVQGSAKLGEQTITLFIDFGSNPVDQLKFVNPRTGKVENVTLNLVTDKQYTANITLEGGKGNLFYWQNAHALPYYSTSANIALNKTATQSSTASANLTASKAVDGDTSGVIWPDNQGSHTNQESQPWWQVDLGAIADISEVKLYNRTDCCGYRLSNYHIFVSDSPFTSDTVKGTQSQSGVSDFHETRQAGSPTSRTINRTGRYLRIQLENTNGILNMGEVVVIGKFQNLARHGTATQSSTASANLTASKAIDGDTSGVVWPDNQGSHTNQESQPWWQIDLGAIADISEVKLYNRTDCCAYRLSNYHIFVSDSPFTSDTVKGTQSQSGVSDFHETRQAGSPTSRTINRTGRYLRIQLENTNGVLNMGEVEVLGTKK